MANVLSGGLPFHDNSLEEYSGEDWIELFGGKTFSQFQVLDYMKTQKFSELASSVVNASGPQGNHNWLLWQQSLYLSMKNSKTDSEKLLFGALCNDLVSHNLKKELTFEESLYALFRTYFNNEVMRRYIVIRKILQKHGKILLFNEPCTVEEQFDNLTPSEILNYIYPGSASHSAYINKKPFVERLNIIADEPSSWYKNIHFAVIFDYLAPNGQNQDSKSKQ